MRLGQPRAFDHCIDRPAFRLQCSYRVGVLVPDVDKATVGRECWMPGRRIDVDGLAQRRARRVTDIEHQEFVCQLTGTNHSLAVRRDGKLDQHVGWAIQSGQLDLVRGRTHAGDLIRREACGVDVRAAGIHYDCVRPWKENGDFINCHVRAPNDTDALWRVDCRH